MATEPEPDPPAAPRADDLAVYVHWPFCRSKCPYCDFNSHVGGAVDHDRWARALRAELDHFAALARRRRVTSIFFGGGTPSLMAPATLGAVIERIADRWSLSADAEITLEANPTSSEAGRLVAYRDAGVNRVSLGVQALDDAALVLLGRGHDGAEAIRAVATARALFDRVSIDLIYGRPDQTVAGWRAELERAVALTGDHLSAYQLTIEKGTPFFTAHRDGELTIPDDATAAALYDVTQSVLDDAGLPAYEISNHARPGGECRHNIATWSYRDYVGLGPGAHGRLTLDGRIIGFEQRRQPESWLAAVEATGHATRRTDIIDDNRRVTEMLMMGLRMRTGVERAAFERRCRRRLEDAVAPDRLERLIAGELLALDGERLRATAAGLRVLDSVLGVLLA